ncbi:MAG: hypothetical protein RMI45_05650 [Ignisphaera sp.]|nr:hypothetical protein [Ignisphaera sp.]MDW8085706.1 hypothetical protein [Ignisphaera sp.]
MMWLALASIVYGMLVSLDPILFTYIGYTLNVTGVYLGLLSATWSVAYILASRVLNGVADEGKNRLLVLISLMSLIVSYICFTAVNHLTAILSYTMHAISVASMNLAVSVTMLENTDSELWTNIAALQKSLSSLSRGTVLLLLSLKTRLSIYNLFWLSFPLTVASMLMLPSITLSFERRFYKLSRNVNEIGMYIRASSSILFLDKPTTAHYIYTATWNTKGSVPLYRILISIAMTTALGDYIFTVLPLILRSHLSLHTMWMAYGIAALLSSFMVILFRNLSTNRRGFALSVIVVRTCILTLGLSVVKDLTTLTTYIVLSSLLYMLIDTVLYNMFIEGSAGFSTANYFVSRELGSIIGSLVGGIVIGFGGDAFLIVAGAIGYAAPLFLL